jgi:hypothetical protein
MGLVVVVVVGERPEPEIGHVASVNSWMVVGSSP